MSSDEMSKVFRVNVSVFMGIGVVLNAAVLLPIVYIRSDDSHYGFDGSLFALMVSSGEFFTKVEGQSFSQLATTSCRLADGLSGPAHDAYSAICQQFMALSLVGKLWIGVIVAELLLGLTTIGLICSRFRNKSLQYYFWVSGILTVVHLGVFLTSIYAVQITFEDDCEVLVEDNKPGHLCAGLGSWLVLGSCVYHGLLLMGIVVMRRRYRTNAPVKPELSIHPIDWVEPPDILPPPIDKEEEINSGHTGDHPLTEPAES